ALRQLEHGNTGSLAAFENACGISPRRWQAALLAEPAQVQDRLQARLHFLRPLLRLTLAALWFVSGIVGLVQPAPVVQSVGADLGLGAAAALTTGRLFSLFDLAIAGAVLCRWRPVWSAGIQFIIVLLYTVALSWARPVLWLDAFGPLLKNLPILVAILLYAALERER